jgi:phytol kinase
MLHNNLAAFVITLLLSLIWLRFVGYAVLKSWIPNNISRKVIHIGTGPLFVLCWLLFDARMETRFLAVVVPLISTVQFALAGLGLIRDKASIQSMSRSGIKGELLKGPFYYGLAFIVVTLIFWKTSSIGIIALMVLCGGDGVADLFGKRYGTTLLPWSKEKTWAGSIAMLIGGFLLSLLMVVIFNSFRVFAISSPLIFIKLFIIALVSTLIESISRSDVDNITVPITAIIIGILVSL